MGCVGNDKYSKILEERALTNGLNICYQYTDKEPTGTCAVLITGKERSLCANLAAANCFSTSHIEVPENKKLIENAEYIYISVSIRSFSTYLAILCCFLLLVIHEKTLIFHFDIAGIFLNR